MANRFKWDDVSTPSLGGYAQSINQAANMRKGFFDQLTGVGQNFFDKRGKTLEKNNAAASEANTGALIDAIRNGKTPDRTGMLYNSKTVSDAAFNYKMKMAAEARANAAAARAASAAKRAAKTAKAGDGFNIGDIFGDMGSKPVVTEPAADDFTGSARYVAQNQDLGVPLNKDGMVNQNVYEETKDNISEALRAPYGVDYSFMGGKPVSQENIDAYEKSQNQPAQPVVVPEVKTPLEAVVENNATSVDKNATFDPSLSAPAADVNGTKSASPINIQNHASAPASVTPQTGFAVPEMVNTDIVGNLLQQNEVKQKEAYDNIVAKAKAAAVTAKNPVKKVDAIQEAVTKMVKDSKKLQLDYNTNLTNLAKRKNEAIAKIDALPKSVMKGTDKGYAKKQIENQYKAKKDQYDREYEMQTKKNEAEKFQLDLVKDMRTRKEALAKEKRTEARQLAKEKRAEERAFKLAAKKNGGGSKMDFVSLKDAIKKSSGQENGLDQWDRTVLSDAVGALNKKYKTNNKDFIQFLDSSYGEGIWDQEDSFPGEADRPGLDGTKKDIVSAFAKYAKKNKIQRR